MNGTYLAKLMHEEHMRIQPQAAWQSLTQQSTTDLAIHCCIAVHQDTNMHLKQTKGFLSAEEL